MFSKYVHEGKWKSNSFYYLCENVAIWLLALCPRRWLSGSQSGQFDISVCLTNNYFSQMLLLLLSDIRKLMFDVQNVE